MSIPPIPEAADVVLVLVTFPDAEAAGAVARALVEEKLAACVNVVPGLRSIYVWEGKVCDESEAWCLIKTRKSLYAPLRDRIAAMHPYQVPEIIAVPLCEGNAPYLDWVLSSTRSV